MPPPITIRTTCSGGEVEILNIPSNCEVVYDITKTTITCAAADYSFENLDTFRVAIVMLITLVVIIGMAEVVRRVEEWVEVEGGK